MLKYTATTLADTEHFINYSLALETVRIAVAIRESADNRLLVSLRSKGRLDIARIAVRFGGGGHRNAAGFRIHGLTIKELKDKLLDLLMTELIENGNDYQP
jgi:phosphoesterase RecJ-like protein